MRIEVTCDRGRALSRISSKDWAASKEQKRADLPVAFATVLIIATEMEPKFHVNFKHYVSPYLGIYPTITSNYLFLNHRRLMVYPRSSRVRL